MEGTESHVYHHNTADEPTVSVKVTRNSKTHGYEVTLHGAVTEDQMSEAIDRAKYMVEHLDEEIPN